MFLIDRISIVKMAVLPGSIYRFNAVPSKIPVTYFIVLEKKSNNFNGITKDHE